MNTNKSKLLGDQDPHPVTVVDKPGNIIFTGPHNGIAIPNGLPAHLGMTEGWLNTAHESHDLHMDKLFLALNKAFDDISLVSGNYSRLVCDVNKMPEFAITENSSEYAHQKILGNQPNSCDTHQRTRRLEEIYWPYHDTKKQLINEKREKHGGIIVLDLHSFTPTWEQQKRNVEIGTIRCEKTPLSYAFEDYLKTQSDFLFISGEPYRIAKRPSNAAPMILENNDLQYLGLEIRNDLIAAEKGIERIISLLKKGIDHLNAHPDQTAIMQKRSEALPEATPPPEIQQSWSI